MASKKKLLQAAAGSAGGAGLDVDEVFSTYLYDGTGIAQTITNGIDITGEGGMTWIKRRSAISDHSIFDTERGYSPTASKILFPNKTDAELSIPSYVNATSSGFVLNHSGNDTNDSSSTYASWTFRKAPKFFDVVTYSGSSSAQTIAHNLGVTPAVMIVKQLNSSGRWTVYHKDASPTGNPQNGRLALNTTDAWNEYPTVSSFNTLWNQTAPTSTHFTVGTNATTGASGSTYVAYLFAHNNGDGEFGPSADQDVIKCGSYTGNGSSTGPSVNLGFEPQWVLIKLASGSGENWILMDNMRGMPVGSNDTLFEINDSGAEKSTSEILNLTATGFDIKSTSNGINTNNQTYIYMAIRRGPLAEPTSATDVFHIQSQSDGATYSVGFPIDTFLHSKVAGSSINAIVGNRLTGNDKYLITSATDAEGTSSGVWEFDLQNSFKQGATTGQASIAWHWKRAPGYFDVVAYSGNSTAGRTVSHNLGVVPEMMWVKARSKIEDWSVYHAGITNPEQNYLYLNNTGAVNQNANTIKYWNHTNPTDSVFTLGDESRVNASGHTYIAYLFATVAGVSKVGSYTGNDTGQNIDCGFSSGARFVLIKCSSHGDRSWMVFDSTRGIVAGADPFLTLNSSSPEYYAFNGAGSELNYTSSNLDLIDPYSSGFAVVGSTGMVNSNGKTYIFYAIA